MTIPFWQRPWLDGAKEFYDEDNEPDDEERCPECGNPSTGLCIDCDPPDAHLMDAYDERNGDIEVDYDFYHAQFDYEPSPYFGDYSEE